MVNRDEPLRIEKFETSSRRIVPVLCREEALVYVENYVRGERDCDDLAALRDFLRLLPKEEYGWYPFDVMALLKRIEVDLDSM